MPKEYPRKSDPKKIEARKHFVIGEQSDYLKAAYEGLSDDQIREKLTHRDRISVYKKEIRSKIEEIFYLADNELSDDEIMKIAFQLGINQGILTPKEKTAKKPHQEKM